MQAFLAIKASVTYTIHCALNGEDTVAAFTQTNKQSMNDLSGQLPLDPELYPECPKHET
jgi:hypothetical protein